jgi:DNA-binding transcriptional MerR regulator
MYNIDQFSQITNINKLVLRTWENRYGLFKATRTKTNIRVYSDDLLVKALNIKSLTENGYKISFLAKQSKDQLNNLVNESKSSNDKNIAYEFYVNKFIEAALNYDALLFQKTYTEGIEKYNIIEFYQKVILQTFSKIGLFWLTNRINPGQEHFLSELIKQKILASTDNSAKKITKSSRWLLFLPPNEFHEIGLIFAKFLLIQNGYDVTYLGSNVPLQCLDHISEKKQIDNILIFSVSNFSKTNILTTIGYMHEKFPKSKKFLVSDLKINSNMVKLSNTKIISDIKQFLKIIK